MAVSPDGHKIASGGFNMPAKVWDVQTGQVSAEFPGHSDVTFWVAWQPDGLRLASAGSADARMTVKVWDALTGDEVFALPPGPEYFAVAFSPDPDARFLVTGRSDKTVQVWNAQSGALVRTLGTHALTSGAAFSRDGQHLLS